MMGSHGRSPTPATNSFGVGETMTDSMSPQGYAVVRSFEGRSLRAYKDVVGVWTIGYGNTNSDASVLGFKVQAGVTITAQQAEDLLHNAMERRYMGAVRAALPGANQETLDAGGSFAYNCGTGAVAKATWTRQWRSNKNARAILAWNKGGGRVLPGLDRRRKRELAMIERGDYGPEGRNRPVDLNADGKPIPGHLDNNAPGMLKLGSTGDEVAELQKQLIELGLATRPELKSGTFDENTDRAVRKFQASHPHLDKDGVAGPATRKTLQRDLDAKRKLSNAGKGTAAGGTAAGGAQAVTGLPEWVWVVGGLVAVAVVGYFVWQYRDEIKGMFNRAVGREVP